VTLKLHNLETKFSGQIKNFYNYKYRRKLWGEKDI